MMVFVPIVEIAVFALFSLIAIAGALGMTTTMSMFRSGLFLMASFFGVAGLFILLSADLLAWLQVMMYIGGMLVMILFMVLFSPDPGGRMMANMEMPPLETLFSRGLHDPGAGDMSGMDMSEMSMTTSTKRPAALVSGAVTALTCALIVSRAPWPTSPRLPDTNSPARIGELLLGKYMLAFEAAGLMILLGVFGAVYLSRPGTHPDPTERDALRAATDAPPVSIESTLPADSPQPTSTHAHHQGRR